MTFYALTSSTDNSSINKSLYFKEESDAIKELKQKADEIRYKLGVDVITDTAHEFSYLFGWEEHKVVFKIVKLEMK